MRLPFLFLVLILSVPSSANGQSQPLPQIEFDVPRHITCRDVTTEEFANTHSLEKLLEVRFKVSSLLANGTDRSIRELFFFIYSPERSFEIVDFTPQTTLITEFAGPVEESRNDEKSNSAGLNFAPTFEMSGKASLNANLSDRQGKTLRTTKLPPMQLAVASGTQKRGTAVYFKLKPSTQLTLEGSNEITLTIKVPVAWRADLMHVHCSGWTALKTDGPVRKSRADFVVPLHLESDAPAKIQCEQFSHCERVLRQMTRGVQTRPVARKSDLASKVSIFVKREILGKKEKPTPTPNWIGEVIFNNHSVSQVESSLNVEIDSEAQNAIRNFRLQRADLLKLNG